MRCERFSRGVAMMFCVVAAGAPQHCGPSAKYFVLHPQRRSNEGAPGV